MAEKKNYLDNGELQDEIIKCIDEGYELALSLGYQPYGGSDSESEEVIPESVKDYDVVIKFGRFIDFDEEEIKDLAEKKSVTIDEIIIEIVNNFNDALKLGYVPERSEWINNVRNFDNEEIEGLINKKRITREDANILSKRLQKPVASDKLGKMFQLMVENVARSFYWQNPDDGLDCKANALLDLCSNFWKFEPANPKTGKPNNAFAFCTQIAYFGIAGAHRILHPKKYDGTISMSCLDENGKLFDLYNL